MNWVCIGKSCPMIPGRMKERNGIEHDVSIELRKVTLHGTLSLPETAKGIVLFAHGSGSSRLSPRNRYVARELQFHGVGTLLFDLLTPQEEAFDQRTMQLRFDIRLMAKRLVGATRWVMRNPEVLGPLCLAEADPILQVRRWAPCGRRRYSSWAVMTSP
jgi:hypothetical protein